MPRSRAQLTFMATLILLTSFWSLVGACAQFSATPGTPPISESTSVAQTVQAKLASPEAATATPGGTANDTPIAPPPTEAPVHAPSAIAPDTDFPCNLAKFVQDVTIPDGTKLFPDVGFEKTWRLQNVGACTWTIDYVVVMVNLGDNPLDAPETMAGIRAVVAPGEIVDISVPMKTPSRPGTYRADFMLMTPSGEVFGIGDDGSEPFWVEIEVVL